MRLYLSLGSNMGERRENILRSVALLEEEFGVKALKLASIRETEPWGMESAEKFLNSGAIFDIDIDPMEVLQICQSVERKLGREPHEAAFDNQGRRIYLPRVIDIDIILYGNYFVDNERLKIPHPLMWERDFVMDALREMDPQRFA